MLLAYAIQLARCAYEQLTVCGADRRPNDFSTTGFVHRDNLEDVTIRRIDHCGFSSVVDQVDFAVRSERRGFVFRTAGRLDRPLGLACPQIHARQALPQVAQDEEISVEEGWSGDIGGDFSNVSANPGDGTVVKYTVPTGPYSVDGVVLGCAVKDDVFTGNRRGNQPPMSVAPGIPGAPSPQFLTRFSIMSRQRITSSNQQLLVATKRKGDRRAESFKRFLPSWRLRLIRNGVSVDASATPEHRRGWVYLGRVSPEKNILRLIDAAEALPDRLALYGPISPPNARFEEAFRRKLENANAEWKGPVPGDRVRETLSRYQVFVNPSSTEGLPFTVLEAAAEGLHLVLSDIRPHRLLEFPSCDYVDPKDIDLTPFVRDTNGDGEANRVHTRKEYNVQTMLQSYLSLYRQVAGASVRS